MSVAWTTILIIALLLPGVFFFTGYATRERYTREIVRSSAIGEVGWAILVAIIIHLLAWGVIAAFGFDLASNLKQIADYQHMHPWQLVDHGVRRLLPVGLYIIGTAIAGLLIGCAFAWAIAGGWLPFLAVQKYINEVTRSMRQGLVTAYVMTTTKENNKVLMYKGVLSEFYLNPDGKFVYVALKSCSRYYMKFDEDAPTTSTQLELFGKNHRERQQTWNYLLIDGAHIANILFDPSPTIVETTEGERALLAELDRLTAQMLTATQEAQAEVLRTKAALDAANPSLDTSPT